MSLARLALVVALALGSVSCVTLDQYGQAAIKNAEDPSDAPAPRLGGARALRSDGGAAARVRPVVVNTCAAPLQQIYIEYTSVTGVSRRARRGIVPAGATRALPLAARPGSSFKLGGRVAGGGDVLFEFAVDAAGELSLAGGGAQAQVAGAACGATGAAARLSGSSSSSSSGGAGGAPAAAALAASSGAAPIWAAATPRRTDVGHHVPMTQLGAPVTYTPANVASLQLAPAPDSAATQTGAPATVYPLANDVFPDSLIPRLRVQLYVRIGNTADTVTLASPMDSSGEDGLIYDGEAGGTTTNTSSNSTTGWGLSWTTAGLDFTDGDYKAYGYGQYVAQSALKYQGPSDQTAETIKVSYQLELWSADGNTLLRRSDKTPVTFDFVDPITSVSDLTNLKDIADFRLTANDDHYVIDPLAEADNIGNSIELLPTANDQGPSRFLDTYQTDPYLTMVGVGATSRYPVSRISVVKDDAGANTLSLSYKVANTDLFTCGLDAFKYSIQDKSFDPKQVGQVSVTLLGPAGSTAYPTAYDDAYSDVSRSRPALLDVLANDQTCGGRVTDIQGPFGVDEGVRAGTLNSDGRRVLWVPPRGGASADLQSLGFGYRVTLQYPNTRGSFQLAVSNWANVTVTFGAGTSGGGSGGGTGGAGAPTAVSDAATFTPTAAAPYVSVPSLANDIIPDITNTHVEVNCDGTGTTWVRLKSYIDPDGATNDVCKFTAGAAAGSFMSWAAMTNDASGENPAYYKAASNFAFTPANSFSGVVTFGYRLTGSATSATTVAITVKPASAAVWASIAAARAAAGP